jgi:hypothetical protein
MCFDPQGADENFLQWMLAALLPSIDDSHFIGPSPAKPIRELVEKLSSTLPCGRQKVEYKFFIGVIEPPYVPVLSRKDF